jgi:HAD superfamily hydrolase (TIGR01549 family)
VARPAAVSLDFFDTLVHHRGGRGRGGRIADYLRLHGFTADPWRRSVFDELFATLGPEYAPGATGAEHEAFCTRVARTLFSTLRVDADPAHADAHALALWDLIGPSNLAVFPDVHDALRRLRQAGLRLIVVSNWDRGLPGFCRALGLADYFETIIASAEVGIEKPDRRIFDEACARLRLLPAQVLHVGDSVEVDVDGARNAGLRALHLRRDHTGTEVPGTVGSLLDVVALLEREQGDLAG